uniref:Uncharacterized protein n=1 Tax=Rhizochromulina marina TaxID=1034831 RepID=A0A7S2SQ25_9STRA
MSAISAPPVFEGLRGSLLMAFPPGGAEDLPSDAWSGSGMKTVDEGEWPVFADPTLAPEDVDGLVEGIEDDEIFMMAATAASGPTSPKDVARTSGGGSRPNSLRSTGEGSRPDSLRSSFGSVSSLVAAAAAAADAVSRSQMEVEEMDYVTRSSREDSLHASGGIATRGSSTASGGLRRVSGAEAHNGRGGDPLLPPVPPASASAFPEPQATRPGGRLKTSASMPDVWGSSGVPPKNKRSRHWLSSLLRRKPRASTPASTAAEIPGLTGASGDGLGAAAAQGELSLEESPAPSPHTSLTREKKKPRVLAEGLDAATLEAGTMASIQGCALDVEDMDVGVRGHEETALHSLQSGEALKFRPAGLASTRTPYESEQSSGDTSPATPESPGRMDMDPRHQPKARVLRDAAGEELARGSMDLSVHQPFTAPTSTASSSNSCTPTSNGTRRNPGLPPAAAGGSFRRVVEDASRHAGITLRPLRPWSWPRRDSIKAEGGGLEPDPGGHLNDGSVGGGPAARDDPIEVESPSTAGGASAAAEPEFLAPLVIPPQVMQLASQHEDMELFRSVARQIITRTDEASALALALALLSQSAAVRQRPTGKQRRRPTTWPRALDPSDDKSPGDESPGLEGGNKTLLRMLLKLTLNGDGTGLPMPSNEI